MTSKLDKMDKSLLLDIAATWSYWDKPVPPSIPRSLKLPKSLSERVALVVQGVRRCGKSTLLAQMVKKYKLRKKDCLFINFEDPRLANVLHHETLEALVDGFREARPGAKALTFFFDEIQWVEGWERWLSSRLDRPDVCRFVVTGSNAHLLSGELATALTGRHITVELFPFDFDEYRLGKSGGSLEGYLRDGGFPEPTLTDDGDLLLRQYFIDIIQRDVRERVGARSSLALRRIAQMVFESAGAEFSLRRIAAVSGVAVETVAAYMEAFEAAFLLFPCQWFAWSERKRSKRNRKYYPVDTGLRRVASTRTGADRGKALECATFIELRKRFGDVFYWRGEGEVDFVVQTDAGILPVQVTLHESRQRHLRSLSAFYKEFPQTEEALVVTLDDFPEFVDRIDSIATDGAFATGGDL